MNRRGFLKTFAVALFAGPALLAEQRPRLQAQLSPEQDSYWYNDNWDEVKLRLMDMWKAEVERMYLYGYYSDSRRKGQVYYTAGIKEGIAIAA